MALDPRGVMATRTIPDVSTDEIAKQVRELRSNEAADEKGVIAEMMKISGDGFLAMVAHISSDILQCKGEVPDF